MRRLLPVLAVVVAAALAAGGWVWRQWTSGPGPADAPPQLVSVPSGMTLAAAADTLAARGLLEHRRVFLAGARLTGRDRGLRSGLYAVSPGWSPRRLLDELTSGRSVQTRVTVPEGLDADEIAAVVADVFAFGPAAFLAAADSAVAAAFAGGRAAGPGPDHARRLAAESDRFGRSFRLCEGYLAPDTYVFALDAAPEAVAGHLVEIQLERLAAAVGRDRSGRTPHELLTLASIVEAEARRDDERTRIAAVYANRLERGRRLEADPTVAYVLGKKGQRLYYRDLEADSDWNTYRRGGLPPGPIGAPGEASLMAAAEPDTACTALYFVSDGADGHVFSDTAREHEEAVRRFRRLRDEARRQAREN
jgi:UPF0755 protein